MLDGVILSSSSMPIFSKVLIIKQLQFPFKLDDLLEAYLMGIGPTKGFPVKPGMTKIVQPEFYAKIQSEEDHFANKLTAIKFS